MSVLDGWKYCPRCRARLRRGRGRLDCDACGVVAYGNSAPTASALVVDAAGRVLLGRRAVEPYRGLWDVPGGFLEEGEDPLDGLRRELREETGLEIEPHEFLGAWVDTYGDGAGSQYTLNLFWTAHAPAGEPRAADDVAELAWFGPDELPNADELAFTKIADVLAAWRRQLAD
jgi:ADP-ribose pyrophosphatase YjhB (NUDIX family)